MLQNNRFITISHKDRCYQFLQTGDIFSFSDGPFMVNQLYGNAKDGSMNNIYLRVYRSETPEVFPLLGIRSNSRLSYSDDCLKQEGCAGGIFYEVTFRPQGLFWFWNISLSGKGETVDLLYGQDVGTGPSGNAYANELYTAQYLGHSIFETDNGYVVCSRQNMSSNDCNPYLQQGVIGSRAIHYSTDGLQFFGLCCKETGIPEKLYGDLEDKNLQYEFTYTALQTEKMTLDGNRTIAFYGMFLQNHPGAIREAEYQDEIMAAYEAQKGRVSELIPVQPVQIRDYFGEPFSSLSFSAVEVEALFPERRLEEKKDETLLSFFTGDHAHVVTKEKELITQRPHGTIIITPPDTEKVNSSLISSTHYMFGVFNSHIVIGNTDIHKLVSSHRQILNLIRDNGQRLYVRLDEGYQLLNLPGLFEMGMNYSRWYYKTKNDVIRVTVYTAVETPQLTMEVCSANGRSYDFILTTQLTKGTKERDEDVQYTLLRDGLRFAPDFPDYPGLHYDMCFPGHCLCKDDQSAAQADKDCPKSCAFVSDDRVFFTDGYLSDGSLLTISLQQEDHFTMILKGSLDAADRAVSSLSFEEEKKLALDYYEKLVRSFHLEGNGQTSQVGILNETVRWYAHNAMIHYSMPHGLEQAGGAAWGTRDICQGPMEFFLTTQHYALARDILCNILSHQRLDNGEWDQWFMFDRYHISPGECHGDVIFWPLKCIADYLNATGDYSLLDEQIPYDAAPNHKESVLAHISRALDNIRNTRLIGDTGLITYAGGDWDDTLQPANEELKEHLVSAWTVALAYQTFHTLAQALQNNSPELSEELTHLAELVKDSFENILIQDGVIAGFLECGDTYTLMLHPRDEKTGIHYRLLPLTRSIIAELVSPTQAKTNAQVIREHLRHPDGARLMDHPAGYDGGISHLFRRAEQAANVGREISLQYTHAHIRYIEAMAKLGDAKEAWDSLFVINPILLQNSVPNAQVRQSNMYFSSSEGAFLDRYDYAENFDLLKTGSIEVKGGWRLYSSGPGIYLRQVIGSVLGVRFTKDGLIIDPVLPASLDGLAFTYECFGKKLSFRYNIGKTSEFYAESDGRALPADNTANPYRRGSLLITKKSLETCGDTIHIFVPNM